MFSPALIAEDRIIVTSNADDFRRLGAGTPAHPGLAVMVDAVGRARQLTLGVGLANAIDNAGSGLAANGRGTDQVPDVIPGSV